VEDYLTNPTSFPLHLLKNERLTDPSVDDVVVKLTFQNPEHKPLPSFIAGQCVRLWLADSPELESAYFAIASNPHHSATYEFVIKAVHPLSNALVDLKADAQVMVEGPMGKGFDLSTHQGKHIILMGVGTGVAPLRSVWLDLIEHRDVYQRVSVYAGFLTSMHHLFDDELASLPEHDVHVSVSLASGHDEWDGAVGYVQHALAADKPTPENTVVCLAGMPTMVDACRQTLLDLGFNERQILLNF